MKKIDLLLEQKEFLTKLELDGKSFNTVKNYKTDLHCYNKYLMEKSRPLLTDGITLAEVKEYSDFLEQKYSSSNSIRRRIQALRIFFDFLVTKELMDNNPVKKAIIKPKFLDAPKPTPFSEVLRLRDYFENQYKVKVKPLEKLAAIRNKILFYFIYSSGLKVSDIANLKLSQIHISDNEMRVIVFHPKRDAYSIPLPPNFRLLFTSYIELLDKQKKLDGVNFDNLMFNANPYRILSGGLSPRGIEVLFKDISEKNNFKITAKNLRQACIVKWILQGHKDSTIKEWMGVQPQYSLKPYKKIVEDSPTSIAYVELDETTEENEGDTINRQTISARLL